MDNLRADLFKTLKHIVVKVGTKILVNERGEIHARRLKRLVREICLLKKEGYSVVLVTSGAVGLGMARMGHKTRPRELAKRQACAAIGQIQLMHYYSAAFKSFNQKVAQVLLSAEDFKIQARYNNIKKTVHTLLNDRVLPIINENDTITTDELKVGDNDKLSTDVAHFLEADLLIMLTDTDGLYPKNPRSHKYVRKIAVVPKITSEIKSMGGGAGHENSTGGMRSKLKAIEQAVRGGIPVVMTDGKKCDLLSLVRGDPVGTLFVPNPQKIKGRKRWIAFISHANGKLIVDEGGIHALRTRNSSLLPAGVVGVRGHFKTGDFVELSNAEGEVVGRGRTRYSSEEVGAVLGVKTPQVRKILKRSVPEEIIHRDHLVMY